MRWWLALVVVSAPLGAGCPAASVSDCAVHCVTGGECPDGLSCGAEGYCRVSSAELTCAALLDGGGGGGDGDGGGGTGGTDAAPCLTPGGCDIVAGRPSPVLEVHRSTAHHGSPHLTSDRLRLYYATGDALWMASRPTPGERFGPSVAVTGDGWGALLFDSVSLSEDELWIAVAGRDAEDCPADVWTASRGDAGDDFGTLTRVELIDDAITDTDPALSPDALELWYASGTPGTFRIMHRRRDTRADEFEAEEPVTLPGADFDDLAPAPSPDGISLLFSRQDADTRLLVRAFRDDVDVLSFGTPEVLDDLTVAGEALSDPFLSEDGHELFFSSTQPWSPAATAIWRVHICNTGSCDDDQILCEPPAVLSPDARHCYNSYDDTANWNSHVQACNTQGGHLVTIHSEAENDMVAALVEEDGVDPIWIGSTDEGGECNIAVEPCWFGWVTDEPDLYEHWVANQPDDNEVGGEDCASLSVASVGFWNDEICEAQHASVCERELPYPWW